MQTEQDFREIERERDLPPDELHSRGEECPVCRGTGGGVWNDCPTCDGNGVVA